MINRKTLDNRITRGALKSTVLPSHISLTLSHLSSISRYATIFFTTQRQEREINTTNSVHTPLVFLSFPCFFLFPYQTLWSLPQPHFPHSMAETQGSGHLPYDSHIPDHLLPPSSSAQWFRFKAEGNDYEITLKTNANSGSRG